MKSFASSSLQADPFVATALQPAPQSAPQAASMPHPPPVFDAFAQGLTAQIEHAAGRIQQLENRLRELAAERERVERALAEARAAGSAFQGTLAAYRKYHVPSV
jgi:small-conductance mechanosensitive channel